MVDEPRVSVVVPTTNRSTLRQAVESALTQTYAPAEVLVVFDLDRLPDKLDLPTESVRTLVIGAGHGANVARQLGADAAAGDVIALLDDDDYWFPGKLEAQVRLLQSARREGRLAVVSCGVQLIDHAGAPLDVVPRRFIAEHQPISDYLFKRRELRWGEATMGSSSLLFDRQLLRAVPFDGDLHLHQDWDWLLRAARDGGAHFLMEPRPLVAYRHPAPGARMSRSSIWRQSVAWADGYRDVLTARQYGDFLLGVSVSLAVDSGARPQAAMIALKAVRQGRPGPAALLAAAALLLLPRSLPRILLSLRARARRRNGRSSAGMSEAA